MTEEELNRLEALAKAATSGPWARHHDPQAYAVYQPEFECWIPQDGSDADFIAAANPATVLSLIALARVGLAVTPRPISASASGIDVIVFYDNGSADYIEADDNDYEFKPYEGPAYRGVARPTHFIPLSALPKPGGE